MATEKSPHLVEALLSKADSYKKEFIEEDEAEEKAEKENSLSTLVSKVESADGEGREEAIDSLISKLQSLKKKK